jgi:hypothetical protein
MANGFKALRHVGGKTNLSGYPIASGYASNIFNGDVVNLTAGNVTVASATGSAQKTGTFLGCMYVLPTNEQKFSPYWPTGTVATEISAIISGDKDTTYKVELAVAEADLTSADVGGAADLEVNAGSPRTGQSAFALIRGAGTFTIRNVIDSRTAEVVAANAII